MRLEERKIERAQSAVGATGDAVKGCELHLCLCALEVGELGSPPLQALAWQAAPAVAATGGRFCRCYQQSSSFRAEPAPGFVH